MISGKKQPLGTMGLLDAMTFIYQPQQKRLQNWHGYSDLHDNYVLWLEWHLQVKDYLYC